MCGKDETRGWSGRGPRPTARADPAATRAPPCSEASSACRRGCGELRAGRGRVSCPAVGVHLQGPEAARLGSRGSGTCAASTATRSTPSYRTPPRAAPGRLLCVVQRSAGSRRPRAWTGATPQRARTAPSPQWRLRRCLARPIEAGSSRSSKLRSSKLTSPGDCLAASREPKAAGHTASRGASLARHL